MEYEKFLKNKIIIAEKYGIDTADIKYSEILFDHQKDIVNFCLTGGRRAVFASFGLGKTFIQLELAKQIIKHTGKPFLIVCPLGVSGEFKRDNRKLGTGYDLQYITDTDNFENPEIKIYLTNYERIRKGDIESSHFGGVSFDEASILRNLQTETTNYVIKHFSKLPFRFVATATPTPNDFIEILNYAEYLGVISRGHALTRFFQRDSQKAGNLKLYENKKDEFWKWVSTWAAFIEKPSDLGYDDTGYNLPNLNIVEHKVSYINQKILLDKWGNQLMFKNLLKSLVEVSKEKRDSIQSRLVKVNEILKEYPEDSFIIWHHLEYERDLLEKMLKGQSFKSVYGSMPNPEKEKRLIEFSENEYQYLLTKPRIAGSGCNFQNAHNMIFMGIDYKFNDFIQSIHREYRFGQNKDVNVHIIYSENETSILEVLKDKWQKHIELTKNMIELVKINGLNADIIKSQMERQIFSTGKKIIFKEGVTVYNNDTVLVHQDIKEMPDNSIDMYLTSIPFGDHYEYSDNYNDFGHNHGNDNFFKQMEYLTPHMLRCLKPGRIACIHVKDRIRYSYQNGTSFTTISDFSGQTVQHFIENGFYLMGKITVTTDVVAENNQTYRLGWTEQTKDASKMGVGLPEYVLIFRKAPSNADNSYADFPVVKSKKEYTKALWQLDAHAYYRSSGNRYMTKEELRKYELKNIVAIWEQINKEEIYDFQKHKEICETLDEFEKLSSTYATIPLHSNSEYVWTDINRMNTLNTNQANAKKEKHICPLQFDIVERLINRYSSEGEVVCDPFGGLGTVAVKSLELGRKCISIELNSEYYVDSLYYIKAKIMKLNMVTLMDLFEANENK